MVIGGPVVAGESVQVDYTTPEPTIVATSKEWLSIEDILRELGKLPDPLMEDPQYEFDKIWCICIDDPTQYFMFEPSYNGWYDAQLVIEADYNDLGYMRRWGVRLPSSIDSLWLSSQPNSWECWYPQYIWGAGREQTHIQTDNFLVSYGVYVENLYIDSWWHEIRAYIDETIESFGWAWAPQGGPVPGNPIRSPGNDYLLLPDQVFNGQMFRNCKIRSGNGEFLPWGDEEPAYNYFPIHLDADGLNGYYWSRDADDLMIFERCHFIVDTDSCEEPRLAENAGYLHWDDGYDTHIYLYDCIVDVGPTPISDELDIGVVHSINTQWIGVPNILDIPHHDILKTSDRATLDHIHGSSGSSGGYDENALHDNETGEIYMVVEKTQPVMDDILLIEDSEASYAKKKVKFDNIPAPGTERFFVNGTITSGSEAGGAWIAPGYGEIENVYMYLKTTGSTSGSTGIDVNKNGVSIYSSNPKPIVAYNDPDNKAMSAPDTNSFQPGDVFTIDIDNVASGSPTDLTVIIAYNLLL
jgi:hypothetical protein